MTTRILWIETEVKYCELKLEKEFFSEQMKQFNTGVHKVSLSLLLFRASTVYTAYLADIWSADCTVD